MTEAYPLHWPDGWPRVPDGKRQKSRFDVTPETAQQELAWEIERMGGNLPVISTNAQLRRDGLPYASRRAPDDPGVAVYFVRKGRQVCLACDRHPQIWENMRAIGKTIEALRGIERWGASEMMDRAFAGFAALPPPGGPHWTDVLGLTRNATRDQVQQAWRRLIRERPESDRQRFNVARDQALREVGGEA